MKELLEGARFVHTNTYAQHVLLFLGVRKLVLFPHTSRLPGERSRPDAEGGVVDALGLTDDHLVLMVLGTTFQYAWFHERRAMWDVFAFASHNCVEWDRLSYGVLSTIDAIDKLILRLELVLAGGEW